MAQAVFGSQKTKSVADKPRYYFMGEPLDHNDALEKIPRLKNELKKALRTCPYEWKVTKVDLLYSKGSECMTRFLKHGSIDESRLLFHGTRRTNIKSIGQTGFDLKRIGMSSGDLGWFGKGIAFTAYPQYAMLYARQGSARIGNEITLVAAYVLTGKIQELTERPKKPDGQWHNGKPIPPEYDSTHVWTENCYPVNPNKKGALVYDDWTVRDVDRILPAYSVTFKCISQRCVVWRDPWIHYPGTDGLLRDLSKTCPIYGVKTNEEGWDLIRYKQKGKGLVIITNGGDDVEEFVRYIRNTIGCEAPILVFCGAVALHEQWAKKYTKVHVTGDSRVVRQWAEQKFDFKDGDVSA